MGWYYLLAAGALEIGFTTCLKFKQETGNRWWDLAFLVCVIASFALLQRAIASIPLGTAYAVWTGIGAFGTALIGIVFFKDPLTLWRIFFLVTLVVSVIGLKLVSAH